MKQSLIALFVAILIAACSSHASIEGEWKVERMVPAPWLPTGQSPDESIANDYLQANVTFTASAIRGPGLLACNDPRYTYAEVPPEGMFQGGLSESPTKNESAEALARSLGFSSIPVLKVSTSCEHDIAFFFSDPNHLAFALDNMIFWLERQN